MHLKFRNALMLLLMWLFCCSMEQEKSAGFELSLAASGEVILKDVDIAAYIWGKHRIVLTPKGVERWQSFVPFDSSYDPPIPKMGGLFGKEFVIKLNGVEMYRGHFWSMCSSQLKPGVLIYETLGVIQDALWIEFERPHNKVEDDPRGRPEIQAYFRKQGKLKE
jgi:hypothetical protein